jgi:hypothetical protein
VEERDASGEQEPVGAGDASPAEAPDASGEDPVGAGHAPPAEARDTAAEPEPDPEPESASDQDSSDPDDDDASPVPAGAVATPAPAAPASAARPQPVRPRPQVVAQAPRRPPAVVTLPQRAPVPPVVVSLDDRRRDEPQEWNVWELDRLARDEARRSPERADELQFLLVSLRQFAEPGGLLPTEFDGLVRESFGGLLDELERT